jgi:ABC-type transport system involved in multi-copper enzyme maturation permease subunit
VKPILSIATTTVGEAVRRKVLLIILMIGVLLLSIIPSLGILSARSEESTMVATMFAVLRFTAMLIAIILTIYMIPNEIERRTIYTILSKPVQRWQFLVGKYLGAVFALALMMVLMTAVMLIMFKVFKPDIPIGRLFEVARQPFFYFIEMSLLTAVCIFFSTFTTPLVNFFLSIGVWAVGTVLNPLYKSIADNSGTPPVMKSLAQFITNVLPNFANYDVKNPLINPGQVIENERAFYIFIVFYGVIYSMVLLFAAMLIFDKREV